MRKKILFVIDSLGCGGAEKSLVSLLTLLDYNKYNVDLQLLAFGGINEQYIPKQVNILPKLEYYQSVDFGIIKMLQNRKIRQLYSRVKFSLKLKWLLQKGTYEIAKLFWDCTSQCFENTKHYDIAIAYAQRLPTYYVAEKVNATKKIALVNCGINLNSKQQKYNQFFYDKISTIVTVSDAAKEAFINCFPQYKNKTTIIYDINNADIITKLSLQPLEKTIDFSKPSILTVARLTYKQKGYDITLNACKILKERGCNFNWYALGDGENKNDILNFIAHHNLSDTFHLLGTTANPYPYFKACTIYVQTSRFEGFGLSIAEARILNKPVVTTEFDAVWNQMVQGKNGIVVPIDAVAVADAVQNLLEHPEKREEISAYQRTEKKGNTEEITKFYKLFND